MASIIRQSSQSAELADDFRTLETACDHAVNLQLSGRLDEAEQLYRDILLQDPQHAIANYGLGMVCVQSQRVVEGLDFLHGALQADPQSTDFWLGYLEALLLSGRSDVACAVLMRGRNQGLSGAAVEDFARRLDAALGGEAERDLLRCLERGDTTMAMVLARSLTGRFAERGVPWKVFGALLWAEGRTDEALTAMRHSVRLLPRDAEAHCNLGLTLTKLERCAEAEKFLCAALEIDPGFSIAHYRLGMTYFLQGRIEDAAASLRRGLLRQEGYTASDDAENHSNLLFVLGHSPSVDAADWAAEHRAYGESIETPLRAAWPQHTNDRDPERPLRVGFVSGDLYDHSVGRFLEPILAHLAGRPGLRLHAYCSYPRRDALSARLHTLVAGWTDVDGLSDAACAQQIISDGIDVLIDLSGHTGHNRLPVFARKPAPVQASWLGYPGTTGLTAMDYYLADSSWLPADEFAPLFTEKLVSLPDRWAFVPHPGAPAVGPLPALESGRLTFGSFHRVEKINAATIRLWSVVLHHLQRARLLLVGIPMDDRRGLLLDRFARHGIGAERLMMHGRCTMDEYLALHAEVDVALDAAPYAGATTTMHSLSMGVPTLTLAGATPPARAGAGILAKLGLDEFIASDGADFIAKARAWNGRHQDLAELRAGLRERLARSPGGQPALIGAHLETALRHMWRRWCSRRPTAEFSTASLEQSRT